MQIEKMQAIGLLNMAHKCRRLMFNAKSTIAYPFYFKAYKYWMLLIQEKNKNTN